MINKVVGDEREDEMEQNLNMVISLNILLPHFEPRSE